MTGRAKELIKRGGHGIDPGMIEDAFSAHPSVALAAAVGKPDAYAGEVPVAYVQLRPAAEITAEALLASARGRIAERAAIPREVIILPSLPGHRQGSRGRAGIHLRSGYLERDWFR